MTSAERLCRRIGIEMEVSEPDLNNRQPQFFWHKGADTSVRGCGREYRFSRPLESQEAFDAITSLCNHFDNEKTFRFQRVNAGFHLHIDYTNKIEEALRFVDLAYSLQDWMYRTVSLERTGNHYCMPLSEVPSKSYHNMREKGYTAIQSFSMPRRWIHYASMINKHSIEIRLHHSTNNLSEILTWCEFWVTLANMSDNSESVPLKTDRQELLDSMNLSEETYNRFNKSLKKKD